MNPSYSPGRTRRAPIVRPISLWTCALALTIACTHGKPTGVARPTDAEKPAAALKDGDGTTAGTRREGGTGTRAKGAEGTSASPPPLADAPLDALAKPRALSSSATGTSTPGHGRLGGGSSQGHAAGGIGLSARGDTVMRQMRPFAARDGALLPAQPEPEFNTEGYASVTENAFLAVKEHPLSTFSSDVDTASYSNARRFLREGRLPPKDAIRVEEWINYFAYAYAPPVGDAPVAIHTEVSDCPWKPEHRLVRIGIKARPIEQDRVPPRNLVFLVDVSGSMMQPNKLPLLKHGLAMLTRQLRPQDRVAIVSYAGSSGLVLPSTRGSDQHQILAALSSLEAGGSTNGGEGIQLAYRVAREHFEQGGINRVVLATDGDFNVGTTSDGELTRLIEEKRKTGVFLTVLGFGAGNVKDSTMELLANKGNGNYAYIDSAAEARKVLVREAGSTLVTVAKDVKLQVEFNPARVQSYRLIGYENRLLAAQDFNDDKKDAGDMGAGHSVTALYEVVPVGVPAPGTQAPAVGPLKYQTGAALSAASTGAELLTVAVRYKSPVGDQSSRIAEIVVDHPTPFAQASTDHRFAVAVAEFAQVLRGEKATAGLTLNDAKKTAAAVIGLETNVGGDRRELLALIDRAQSVN
jgi:Ca-activated chloride channel family protein